VAAGRVGKADEDEELEVFPGVESSSEWESKKLVMGTWKRRRLVIDSMMMGGKGARLQDCWSVCIPRADQSGGGGPRATFSVTQRLCKVNSLRR
jgi:hypothetical protein